MHNPKVYPHRNFVWRAQFHPQNVTIATSSRNVQLWDVSTGERVAEWHGTTNGIACRTVCMRPGDSVLTLVRQERTVLFCDGASGSEIATLSTPSRINCLAYSPTGQFLVAGCANKKAYVWDYETKRLVAPPLSQEGEIYDIQFATSERVAIRCKGTTSRIWNAVQWTPIGDVLRHEMAISAMSWSNDGRCLLTASEARKLHWWDAGTAVATREPTEFDAWIWATSFSPDDRHLLLGTESTAGEKRGSAALFDVQATAPLKTVNAHALAVTTARFSPNGQYLLSAAADGLLKIATANAPQTIAEIPHAATIYDAGFSPDGNLVYSCCADNQLRIWQLHDLIANG